MHCTTESIDMRYKFGVFFLLLFFVFVAGTVGEVVLNFGFPPVALSTDLLND